VYLAAAAVWTLAPAVVSGQTTFATITGTVTDSTGAVISAATITATNVETNISTTTQANELGLYTIAQLREGTYTVRAKAAGFKEFVAQNVVLISRDLRRLDIQLDVGSVETSVEVTAGATLIETETARLADAKTAEVMKTLPLNTRGLWAFLALSPNVLQAGGGSSTIRFAGSRGNQSNWAIDGVTFSDGVDNTQIGPLANYIESFQEIKIDMANNTAEFGTIGQVTIVSKSGTNKLSGVVFDYYSTPWFRARDPFAVARPAGISHVPGGAVGGPVYLPKIYNGKNKTFFFFSFETNRGSAVNQLLNPTVPLAPWRSGDFSALTGTTIYDPNGGAPFPGNRIPASRINPVSQRIQDRFYPLPQAQWQPDNTVLRPQNYREMKVRPRDPSTYWTTRGDHRFSDKDMVFGRFTFQRLYNRTYEGNLPTIGRRYQQRDNRAVAGSWTHTFRPTLLNEFRYGFALNNNPVEGPINGPAIIRELGIVGLVDNLPNIPGILKVNWAGIGLTGITQPDYTRPGFRNFLQDFQDHVSWFRGKHNMKLGANITRIEWDNLSANPNLFGSVTFSNRFTSLNQGATSGGQPYADFLLGIPTNSARAFPPVRIDRLRWQYDFYFTDDWKVSQRLTLNLGIRYELHPGWREQGNMTSMFDIGSGNIVIEDGAMSKVSPLFPRAYVGIVEASSLGLPGRTLIRTDRNNFAPRIGIAWRPFGQRTVFRMGYGLFYDVVPRNLNQGAIPFVLNEPGFTNAAGNPTVILPRVFPATSGAGPSTVGIPAAVNPNLKIPYSMQYNFTIEKQMWETGFRLSYVGTNTRQGDWSYDFNSPLASTVPYVDKPRAFPNYPGISYFTNGAGHQYHALTAEAERYMAKGLYFQTSWAWARDIGDLARGASPEYAYDRLRERAVELDIPTHRFNVNWIYQFPFGRGQKFLSNANRAVDLMVRGWEITGIYSYYSNQFLTPLWTGPDPTGTRFSPNRTAPVTTIRPDVLRNGNLPSSQRSVTRWFDASAFAAPQPGRFGTASRGLIKGPSVNVWHGGFIKNFIFSEKAPRLRWELTATNFFNHPNYSNPAMDITALANVGVISSVGGVNGASTGDVPGARAFRTGLRMEW
jgi:hypothetical protein